METKTKFINFRPEFGFSINTYRIPYGYFNYDVTGLVADALSGSHSSCELDGTLDAINDGSLWKDSDQEILEELDRCINMSLTGK